MFGRLGRVAIAFPLSMLFVAIFAAMGNPVIDIISTNIGADSSIVTWGSAIVLWMPVFAFVSLLMDIIAGAVVESGY